MKVEEFAEYVKQAIIACAIPYGPKEIEFISNTEYNLSISFYRKNEEEGINFANLNLTTKW